MIFYRFHEAGGPAVVITNDITGSNLPVIAAGWKADGQTEIADGRDGRGVRFGVEANVIIDAIQRHGYFVGSIRSV